MEKRGYTGQKSSETLAIGRTNKGFSRTVEGVLNLCDKEKNRGRFCGKLLKQNKKKAIHAMAKSLHFVKRDSGRIEIICSKPTARGIAT